MWPHLKSTVSHPASVHIMQMPSWWGFVEFTSLAVVVSWKVPATSALKV